MKKLVVILLAIVSPGMAHAQGDLNVSEVFRTASITFVFGLFMWFCLSIMKRVMDHKLKNKILDRGIPDNLVSSILSTNPKEDPNVNIKWFAILAALGVALTAIHYTLPLGFHSLAIMAFCLSVGFLGYFFFLKYSDKKQE